ncbi:MAG: ABC transporter ATP-binding protein [Planctomycetes bacterium]|nr:ABC transporter ATP-binding protein [Planctomycetota bacterium]
MAPSIQARGLEKTYRLYGSVYDRLRERLPWNRVPRHRPVHALRDVNFDVAPGECVGLVGGNGAGKSTLLKILTGTTFPSAGSYSIRGRVASLLELGAGFHADFTGRENIYMNAAMMGLSRRETHQKYQEILDFSELHEFIDAPIRTYSSGMVCRLGFSVAVATDPDVLIIDEILAVGDMHFQRKCVERIWDYKKRGKTLFFCSHSLYDVRQLCDRAIWLKQGRVELMADAVTVTNEYATYEHQLMAKQDRPSGGAAVPPAADELPRIVRAQLVDPRTGLPRHIVQPREPVAVRVQVRNGAQRVPLCLAIGFTRSDGILMFAHTTQLDGVEFDFAEGVVTLVLPNLKLLSGEFVVPVWLMDGNGVHRFHERPAEQNLLVQNRTKELGYFVQEHEWKVEPGGVLATQEPLR